MIAFRDRRGRLWAARIDVAAALRLRDLAGVDVMALTLDPRASELLADPARLVDAAFALFARDCGRLGLTDRAFGRRLGGWRRPAVAPAELAESLLRGIGEFFRVPRPTEAEGRSREDAKRPPAEEPTAAGLWGDLWKLAGVAGVDPRPHTFGELASLADARRKHDWSQTAHLLAMQHNCHAGPGAGREPAEFDASGGLKPSVRATLEVRPGSLATLAALFRGR